MTDDNSTPGGVDSAALPMRKSRLRRKDKKVGARRKAPMSGNVVPLTHFLPKNWLVLWGAGLFCLATVSLIPIILLESSTLQTASKGTSSASTTTAHGVHKLMDVANSIRAKADMFPKNGSPLLQGKTDVTVKTNQEHDNSQKAVSKPLSLTEKQAKPRYRIQDLTPDQTNWQAKPVSRGVAGRPMGKTPALEGAQRGHIECDLPVDGLAYWNNPVGKRDSDYKTPFKPNLEPGQVQYITFTPDRGGWNNVRMSMEIIFVLAAATGRTLVLPPKEPLYLLNKDKGLKHRGFADFFPLDKLPIEIVSMKEFLEREAGKLFELPEDEDARLTLSTAAEMCDKREKAKGPCSIVENFLDKIGHNPKWPATQTCLIFDKAAMESAPSDAAFAIAAEYCGEKRKPTFWNQEVAAENILHFPAGQKDFRLLSHFYNYVFFSDPVESHYYKRFVRDYLHYHDSIFCAAGKIVQAVQVEGQNRGFQIDDEGAGGFSALHVRRGDLQYKRVKIPASEWYQNTKEIWQDKEILYVATDERNKTFFDDLAVHYDLRFLDDYWDLAKLGDLDPNYMGMIDTIVASRGRAFAGTYFSTFTGGYDGMTMKDSWYSFLPQKTKMHEWSVMDFAGFAYEWPDGWMGIDADEWPSRDKF
eukprot:scaffold9062_cov154-Amphora_coffeaeformis.AAC.4